METVRLFRPVGLQEWRLIEGCDATAFPPRLPEQPIFYPVLNRPYAAQIARDWNTTDPNSGYCGIVTCFDVECAVANRYQPQQVGDRIHRELWVPAEELDAFNRAIVGRIRALEVFYGPDFRGDPIVAEEA